MKDVIVIGAGKTDATMAGLLVSTGGYRVTFWQTAHPMCLAASTGTNAFASRLPASRTA